MKNGEFERKDWIIYICGVVIIFLICIFGGCKTTASAAGNTGYTNAYIIGQLAESVNEFDRGAGEAVNKSRDITDAVDRIDSLFTEYERAALRLRDEVDSLRKQIQDKDKGDSGRDNSNSSTHNSLHNYDDYSGKGN